MKFASFVHAQEHPAQARYGVVTQDTVYDLQTSEQPTLRAALANEGIGALMRRATDRIAAGNGVGLNTVQLLSPITNPEKILCVGLNFFKHAQEAGMAVPSKPSIFVRYPSSLVGHGAAVERPKVSDQFDYEAELAVVIGKAAYQVTEAQALDHVAGYACLAENSVRDWQRHSNQATPGKNFMRSGAFGPWLVTPDESGPAQNMNITGWLNGECVQSDSGANMIFTVAQTIAYLSTFTELVPGDVVSLGTPSGVGFSRKPPRYLKPGDLFEVDISNVGRLSNAVVQGN